VAPVHRRSIVLLWGGLAVFLAVGGVSTFIDLPAGGRVLLYPVMVTSWFIGACGVVGYVRWFFGQVHAEARKAHSLRQKE
jgi:hypothetical protein